MKRNFGIGVLVLCFSLSSVNASLADQVEAIAPIIVQPYEIQELNQQMIDRDRQNRDEEIEIKGLIEENNKLTRASLANQQDEGLAKINQTMLSYRDALLSRDRAHIVANGEKWWSSRYGDLIALTEDADAMTVHQDLESKNDFLAEKYRMLGDLKDEMMALNAKLSSKDRGEVLNKKQESGPILKNIVRQDQDKIRDLVQKLGDMDKNIIHIDNIIAQKDRQIERLKYNLADVQKEAAAKNGQVELLKSELENKITQENNKGQETSAKQGQVDLLKEELEDKITELNSQGRQVSAKNEIIKQQENQAAILKAQSQELSSKDRLIKSQLDQLARASEQLKGQNDLSAKIQAEVIALKNKIQRQDLDLKARDESIRWLNQVVAVVKNKAKYYKLTSQQDRLSIQQVQEEVRQIKDDFAQRSKNYDQFESAIVSLKEQVDLLKSELADKTDQINQFNQIKRAQAKDDRLKLAQQLVDLQQQEAALLDEKGKLALQQYDIFDRHFAVFENKMKILLENHRIQAIDVQDRMAGLENDLGQKQQEIDSLKGQLEEKIAYQKDQDQLESQIQDLKAQLQDKEDQIATMKKDIREGLETKEDVDSLKQQLADQQDKADRLKQQLDSKIAESDKMTLMMSAYQKKLESRDEAYNEEFKQLLQEKAQVARIKKDMFDLQELTRDNERDLQAKDLSVSIMQQKLTDKRINAYQEKINALKADLALARQQLEGMPSSDEIDFLRSGLKKATVELKQKDAMLSQIKANAGEYEKEFKEQSLEFRSLKEQLQNAYVEINHNNEDLKNKGMEIVRLKESSTIGEGDLQDQVRVLTRRLNAAEKKQQINTHENNMEASLQAQLKQKDQMISQVKANADEYKKEFEKQSLEFQSLKEQLQDAYDEISRKNEDLKYKDMEVARLKERSKTGKSGHENKLDDLEDQLTKANLRIKELQAQLDQFILPSKKDVLREKLKQALDKVDEQGRMINVLAQKLQDCGQSVNLTQNAGKP